MLIIAALFTVIAHYILSLSAGLTAGLFAGSLTNTPALASVLDTVKNYGSQVNLDHLLNEPVVGYSLTYPMGVIGTIVAIVLMQRLWKVDYTSESRELSEFGTNLQNRTILVTRSEATAVPIAEMVQQHQWKVIFGRLQRQEQLSLSNSAYCFEIGDLVTVIGSTEELERVTCFLGEISNHQLDFDRNYLDFRRIFVSNPEVVGHPLQELHLYDDFGALATRLRRGDIDFLPQENTVLQLGDRIRVVAPRNQIESITHFFGDSYRGLSEIDFFTLSFGLALGLLVGLIPIPFPNGLVVKLGSAGGPLLVAMILGTLGRTGPLVWNIPYGTNITLRQVGLILFLAGVGTRSGYAFVTTFTQGNGLAIFIAGALITFTTALVMLWLGRKILKMPMGLLTGMLAGLQTQPAVLGFTLEQTNNEMPNVGYTAVYPIAIIMKILLAQLIVLLLR